MRDCFDYDTYWWIIDRLAATNRPVCFADLVDGIPPDPFFILRHDVDYSTEAALRLAEQESRRGVRATYFLLMNCFYYNLLSPGEAHVARRLAELGHEVGLHYDVNFFRVFSRKEWDRLLRTQASILEKLSGEPVLSIAMHQPGLNGQDPFRDCSEFTNAYDDRFVRDMLYVSDSCRAWYDHAWKMLESGPVPSRIQLVLHPINWSETDRDRATIFTSLHRDLARSVEAAGDDLLAKIYKHKGVLEHQARARRREDGEYRESLEYDESLMSVHDDARKA